MRRTEERYINEEHSREPNTSNDRKDRDELLRRESRPEEKYRESHDENRRCCTHNLVELHAQFMSEQVSKAYRKVTAALTGTVTSPKLRLLTAMLTV